ncbi:hypothetical protein [Lyngbya confervoides]|uniref:Uncharacterized protein n=1 Tax=Lyngbya confervoides BDU141951 TaxID=1574623 RepID=A0ABD4T791_9CYAN|nr:hypothetical protein [Lyngbya confervoides]MCM1984617.1 hypothetical protein [Lyngbya confervoides BDU141951]
MSKFFAICWGSSAGGQAYLSLGPVHRVGMIPANAAVSTLIGDPCWALQLSQQLCRWVINGQPMILMIFASVAYNAACQGKPLGSAHSDARIRSTVAILVKEIGQPAPESFQGRLPYWRRSRMSSELVQSQD